MVVELSGVCRLRRETWSRAVQIAFVFASSILLVACEAPAPKEAQLASAKTEVACEEEAPTGSRIGRLSCKRVADKAQAERNAQDAVNTIQRTAAGQTTTSD